jgi:hypothetical protein
MASLKGQFAKLPFKNNKFKSVFSVFDMMSNTHFTACWHLSVLYVTLIIVLEFYSITVF